jgi:hypothetical protein
MAIPADHPTVLDPMAVLRESRAQTINWIADAVVAFGGVKAQLGRLTGIALPLRRACGAARERDQ